MIEKFPTSFDESMEILELERVISHMEVDLSYHQSQTRFFEKKIMEGQDTLEMLRRNSHPSAHLRHSRHSHSHCDDSHIHHDDGDEHEM